MSLEKVTNDMKITIQIAHAVGYDYPKVGAAEVKNHLGAVVRWQAFAPNMVLINGEPFTPREMEDLKKVFRSFSAFKKAAIAAAKGEDELEAAKDAIRVIRNNIAPKIRHRLEKLMAKGDIKIRKAIQATLPEVEKADKHMLYDVEEWLWEAEMYGDDRTSYGVSLAEIKSAEKIISWFNSFSKAKIDPNHPERPTNEQYANAHKLLRRATGEGITAEEYKEFELRKLYGDAADYLTPVYTKWEGWGWKFDTEKFKPVDGHISVYIQDDENTLKLSFPEKVLEEGFLGRIPRLDLVVPKKNDWRAGYYLSFLGRNKPSGWDEIKKKLINA